jgi:hypothetical protein
MAVKTRAELDSRYALDGCTFYQQLANKFNKAEWKPISIAMPNVHSDFSEAISLPLQVKPITAEEEKIRYVLSRSILHLMHQNWLTSGSGKAMLSEEQDAEEVYAFVDRDDRQDFLGKSHPSHILYLWQIGWEHQVLGSVTQTLNYDDTAEGCRVGLVATPPKKKQRLIDRKSDLSRKEENTTSINDFMKTSLEQAHETSAIQALLESKQREQNNLQEQLSRANEFQVKYELELCSTENSAKISVLKRAINQTTQTIAQCNACGRVLTGEIAQLQLQLQEKICVQKVQNVLSIQRSYSGSSLSGSSSSSCLHK